MGRLQNGGEGIGGNIPQNPKTPKIEIKLIKLYYFTFSSVILITSIVSQISYTLCQQMHLIIVTNAVSDLRFMLPTQAWVRLLHVEQLQHSSLDCMYPHRLQ